MEQELINPDSRAERRPLESVATLHCKSRTLLTTTRSVLHRSQQSRFRLWTGSILPSSRGRERTKPKLDFGRLSAFVTVIFCLICQSIFTALYQQLPPETSSRDGSALRSFIGSPQTLSFDDVLSSYLVVYGKDWGGQSRPATECIGRINSVVFPFFFHQSQQVSC